VVSSGEAGLKKVKRVRGMESYTTRSVRFFFKSIRTLKKESDEHRWTTLCKDATSLFQHLYVKQFGPLHLDYQQLWDILFDPPLDMNDPLYMRFEILCSNDKFIDFFMIILQALLDPPSNWWKSHS
jgi:hypothetical protein